MTSFTRRKFTIPEHLDERLVELADQHYQGNVSLCIRAAVEDHRSTLNGTGQEALHIQRFASQLESVKSRQAEICELVEKFERNSSTRNLESNRRFASEDGMTEPMRIVFNELLSADVGLRFGDLRERLDLTASELQSVLGLLVDRGHVVNAGNSKDRFVPATYHHGDFQDDD